ncbi:MAG TPA: hypothetical protein VK579_06990 [Terriglobales bacterium]|jgi:hypothetical protein|nr:hypothetical protein [Terriglobales bacterium]
MKTPIVWAATTILCVVPLLAQQSGPSQSSASDVSALQQQIRDLQDRLISLEGQMRMLQGAQPATAAPAAGAPQPSVPAAPTPQIPAAGVTATGDQTPTLGGAGGSAAKALNPDISVIGDFVGAAGTGTVPALAQQQPFPSMQMHESEIGLQAIIDPYARGDFFISFGEAGVNLEEGYITFTALPESFVVKVGKMRSAFGKVNMMHNHVLPWIDRPLATTNLVGGEDGIDDAGVSIQRIIPAPKGIFLEATGQLFRGDSGEGLQSVFKSWQRSDVSTVAHLRSYKDLSESTNLDLGVSYARGYNDFGPGFITNLYGVDATVRWKPLRRSIYHSFIGRSELFWSQRQQRPVEQRAFGFYTSADYQLGRRWFLGGRFDRSDRSQFANLTDKGASVVLTYWPSEFSQVRGQYRFSNYAENRSANELLLQLIFSLGAHGAHPF